MSILISVVVLLYVVYWLVDLAGKLPVQIGPDWLCFNIEGHGYTVHIGDFMCLVNLNPLDWRIWRYGLAISTWVIGPFEFGIYRSEGDE